MTEQPQARKAFDAEGKPVLITEQQTEAGIAQHVVPDKEALKEAQKSADKDDDKNSDEKHVDKAEHKH